MAKQKLNFRYHNPNSKEDTIKLLSRVFFDVSRAKFDRVLKAESEKNHLSGNKGAARQNPHSCILGKPEIESRKEMSR